MIIIISVKANLKYGDMFNSFQFLQCFVRIIRVILISLKYSFCLYGKQKKLQRHSVTVYRTDSEMLKVVLNPLSSISVPRGFKRMRHFLKQRIRRLFLMRAFSSGNIKQRDLTTIQPFKNINPLFCPSANQERGARGREFMSTSPSSSRDLLLKAIIYAWDFSSCLLLGCFVIILLMMLMLMTLLFC